ncbi:unnamed protein product, partial [Porites evermanni]
FAKEFGRGVRQQRTRGKTKERAGTLPLALSMFRRNASGYGEVDLQKEVQRSEEQTAVQDAAEELRLSIQKATYCHEEQRLVALLQGSVESDDSRASGGDEEEGEQAQADNFSEPIRFEAGRSRSGR